MRYSAERKEAVLKKRLPPNNRSIREIAEEEGISEATLYNWRKAARASTRSIRSSCKAGCMAPRRPASPPSRRFQLLWPLLTSVPSRQTLPPGALTGSR